MSEPARERHGPPNVCRCLDLMKTVKENFRDPEMGVSPPFPEIPTSHVTSLIASILLIFLYMHSMIILSDFLM